MTREVTRAHSCPSVHSNRPGNAREAIPVKKRKEKKEWRTDIDFADSVTFRSD